MTKYASTRPLRRRHYFGPLTDNPYAHTMEKAIKRLGVIRCNDAEHLEHSEDSEQHRINKFRAFNGR